MYYRAETTPLEEDQIYSSLNEIFFVIEDYTQNSTFRKDNLIFHKFPVFVIFFKRITVTSLKHWYPVHSKIIVSGFLPTLPFWKYGFPKGTSHFYNYVVSKLLQPGAVEIFIPFMNAKPATSLMQEAM